MIWGHIMRSGITAGSFALAGLACLGSAPAAAGSYQYAKFGITLNPPGDVNVLGIDAAGDAEGYIHFGKHRKFGTYAFAYINGGVQLATPVGGKFYSIAKGISSNGIAIVYKRPVGRKHMTAFKWDVVANKLLALYATKPTDGFFVEYINSSGDLAGSCNPGACLVSGDTIGVMTNDAGASYGAGAIRTE